MQSAPSRQNPLGLSHNCAAVFSYMIWKRILRIPKSICHKHSTIAMNQIASALSRFLFLLLQRKFSLSVCGNRSIPFPFAFTKMHTFPISLSKQRTCISSFSWMAGSFFGYYPSILFCLLWLLYFSSLSLYSNCHTPQKISILFQFFFRIILHVVSILKRKKEAGNP